jgi:hypothetical protein
VRAGGEGLEELSRGELLALLATRDEALAARDARIDALLVQVGELTAQVQVQVLVLGKDSPTSSKPPSSDGPDRRPRGGLSRKSTGRKPGKQPGAPGQALALRCPAMQAAEAVRPPQPVQIVQARRVVGEPRAHRGQVAGVVHPGNRRAGNRRAQGHALSPLPLFG